jgi:hypothetical protein
VKLVLLDLTGNLLGWSLDKKKAQGLTLALYILT